MDARDQREREPKDTETSERMADVAVAKMDAYGHMLKGEHETAHAARWTIDRGSVEAIIAEWPEGPQRAARQMLEQYGRPNEATPTKLFWYGNGPWKRTIVTADVLTHNFPTTHSDYIANYIDYQVPVDKVDEITAYDGSCLVDRTAGEVAARCDSEAANIVTLNFMHEIVTGRLTVEQARQKYAEVVSAFTLGRSTPYAERLQFEVPHSGTEDLDESIIAGPMLGQMAGKAKDVLTGGDRDTRDTA